MNEFKLIKSLGLQILGDTVLCGPGNYVQTCRVEADELEAILQKGVKMLGLEDNNGVHAHSATNGNYFPSFTGLLINIQPVERLKPVKMQEIIDQLALGQAYGLIRRINEVGVLNE